MTRVFLFLIAILASAQEIRIGALAGLRVTADAKSFGWTSESRRYLIGPSVEVGLPSRFSFEADALYSRLGSGLVGGPSPSSASIVRYRFDSWQLPLLVNKGLPIALLKPFVMAGYAPRVTEGSFSFRSPQSAFDGGPERKWTHGFVTGAGLRTGFGRLGFSPQVRYTRWTSPFQDSTGSQGRFIRSNQNEVQILLGISWKVR